MHQPGAVLEIIQRRGDRVLRNESGAKLAKLLDRRRFVQDACNQLRQTAVGQPKGVGKAVVAGEAVLVFDQTVTEGDGAGATFVDRQVDVGADVDRASAGEQ